MMLKFPFLAISDNGHVAEVHEDLESDRASIEWKVIDGRPLLSHDRIFVPLSEIYSALVEGPWKEWAIFEPQYTIWEKEHEKIATQGG